MEAVSRKLVAYRIDVEPSPSTRKCWYVSLLAAVRSDRPKFGHSEQHGTFTVMVKRKGQQWRVHEVYPNVPTGARHILELHSSSKEELIGLVQGAMQAYLAALMLGYSNEWKPR